MYIYVQLTEIAFMTVSVATPASSAIRRAFSNPFLTVSLTHLQTVRRRGGALATDCHYMGLKVQASLESCILHLNKVKRVWPEYLANFDGV